MKALTLVLPALALGGAALLVAPAPTLQAFSVNGDVLQLGQRDVRLFNNFADASANNNNTPHPMFPGFVQAEMSIWKGVVEWGSLPHGDGSGDPTQANLGDGGANFDTTFVGNATAVGTTDNNIVSAINGCGSGVLAFAERPSSNGWRIRFCDAQWQWTDNVGNPFARQDIQGVMTHEYGHVLGLNHTGVGQATMFPSTAGGPAPRSIHADDIAGVQAVYGVAADTKPVICSTSVNAGTLTIRGVRFDPVDNDVWFPRSVATSPALGDPRIRLLGVPSTKNGTEIVVTIPVGVGPGDVLVKTSDTGGKSLSNAFPMDPANPIAVPCLFAAAEVSPSTIEVLDPGTAQSVTVSGFAMNTLASIDLNGNPIDPSRYTVVNDETVTIDMPLGVLGTNTLTLSDGTDSSDIDFTIVEPALPKLELGTGDDFNETANGQQMNVVLAGKVGTVHQVWFSKSPLPSNHMLANWLLGNNFTDFRFALARTMGPDGYHQSSPTVVFGGVSSTVFYCQSIDLTTPPSPQYGVSNLQIITLTP